MPEQNCDFCRNLLATIGETSNPLIKAVLQAIYDAHCGGVSTNDTGGGGGSDPDKPK